MSCLPWLTAIRLKTVNQQKYAVIKPAFDPYFVASHELAGLALLPRGEEITVTRRGVPIARLIADHPPVKPDVAALIERIKSSRHKSTLEGLNLSELIEEGRD